jgi:hypothetical protein
MRRIQFKSCLVLFVSALWLLSITAPSVLQLLDEQVNYVTYTLNEEESKEQENSDSGEEILLSSTQQIEEFTWTPYSAKVGLHTSQSLSAFCPEIHLPPPETVS